MFPYLSQLVSETIQSEPGEPLFLDQANILSRYQGSKARLFLFDWDGTLTPIVRDPAAAVPTATTLQTISQLASDYRNQFWIISGRDKAFLDKHFGKIAALGLSAEHGAFIRRPYHTQWECTSEATDIAWQNEILAVIEGYTNRTPGAWIEQKNLAITWHYRNASAETGALNSTECKKRLEELFSSSICGLEVMNGKMCLEVRPKNINKGAITRRILDDYAKHHPENQIPDFSLCVGDDVTDEGLFLF